MNKIVAIILALAVAGAAAGFVLINGNSNDISEANTESQTQDSQNTQPAQDEPVGDEEGATGETVSVSYTDSGFEPAEITIEAGTTVVFTNNSSNQMWVASDVHPTHQEFPEFDQLRVTGPSSTYEFTFNESGTYGYHNHAASQRVGTIIVK